MGYNDLGNIDYSGNTDTGNLDYSGAVDIGNTVQGVTSAGTVWDQIDGAHQAQVPSYGQVPSQVQSQVPSQVPSYGQVPNYSQVPSYGQVPVQGQVGGEAKLHSATYSVSDAWSKPMEYEDEFSWSVGGQEAGQGAERGAWQLESVESRLVADNRLTQDYDDIDYTSGNLVSFHTSLAR